MKLLVGIAASIGTVLFFFVLLGTALWALDFGWEMTITEKRPSGPGGSIVLTPRYVPWTLTYDLPPREFCFVRVGWVVVYHLRSSTYTIFDSSGRATYDSEKGLLVPPPPECLAAT